MTDLVDSSTKTISKARARGSAEPAPRFWRQAWVWICTAALLGGIAADRALMRKPSQDSAAYHQRVRAVAEGVPFHFDRWLGVDVPVPQGAVSLLKPNVLLSRRYEEMGSGRRLTLLLVHCKDARDILGHYPPVCYAGQGWTLVGSQPRDWTVEDLPIKATRYTFKPPASEAGELVSIDNFMLLANGTTARDMDEVEVAAQDARRKYFGAAQVQIVYDASVSEADRASVFDAFVTMLKPLILTIEQQSNDGQP